MSNKVKMIEFLQKSDEELQMCCDENYFNNLMPVIARLQIKLHIYGSRRCGYSKLECIKQFTVAQNCIRDELKAVLKKLQDY